MVEKSGDLFIAAIKRKQAEDRLLRILKQREAREAFDLPWYNPDGSNQYYRYFN